MSDDIYERIISWLKEKKPELEKIDKDDDLMQSGALDSLQFVSFMMFIEKLRGKRIEQDDVIPENFQTLHAIKQCFF